MSRQFRLWSQDYKRVLLETTDSDAVEQFLRDSGLDWLPLVIDYGAGWKTRWSGRMELKDDGTVESHSNAAYLKYMHKWPSSYPPVGVVGNQPAEEEP